MPQRGDLESEGDAADAEDDLGPPLYLRRHRLRAGRQTITVIVPRRPARAGIDPLNKLIQRETSDNVVDVESPAAGPARRGG